MLEDNRFTPTEAVRLAALGTLALGERSYADLAKAVRHFTSRYWGPTLDVMGSSIELLRFEGLVEAAEEGASKADTVLRLTDKGRAALEALVTATVRAPGGDFNKLAVALKLRFMHFLPRAAQRDQVEALIEMSEAELARLRDLRESSRDEDGYLLRWLDHDIARAEGDLAWFRALLDELSED